VGATHLARREWAHLSQGERQRILIARSLMARPKLLILDDPCAGLDPVAREEFLWFLEGIAKRRHGPALVLVIHHAEEIMPAFTHALLLRDGRAFAAGLTRAEWPARLQRLHGRLAALLPSSWPWQNWRLAAQATLPGNAARPLY